MKQMMKQILILTAAVGVTGYVSPALAQDAAAGKVLYEQNCLVCHGNKGQGGIGKKLAGDAGYWSFAIFKRAIYDGIDDHGKKMKPIMPVFGKIGLPSTQKPPTDDELKNIQAYVQSFGPKQ